MDFFQCLLEGFFQCLLEGFFEVVVGGFSGSFDGEVAAVFGVESLADGLRLGDSAGWSVADGGGGLAVVVWRWVSLP